MNQHPGCSKARRIWPLGYCTGSYMLLLLLLLKYSYTEEEMLGEIFCPLVSSPNGHTI